MPRSSLQVTPHLNDAELTKRVQECQDPIEKNRWLAIQLLSQPESPMNPQQVATVLNYSVDWVRKQLQRYNRLGAEGLINGRQRRQQRSSRRRMERDRLSPSARLADKSIRG